MITVHDLDHVDPSVVEAWLWHIADNMRASDLEEAQAMSGLSPADALVTSYAVSSHAFAVIGRDGDPVAMFGAAPHPLPGVGVVWMLGTEGIRKEAAGIARASRRHFDELNAAYPILWNYIDGRNAVSMRWLRWGGFKLIGETAMGPEALPFHIFARSNLV